MCGIFGHYTQGGADPALLERMALRLAHRGPDGHGVWSDGAFGFGAGRLAIIDLAAPAGPIFNEDGAVGVAFNGEIYNYRELRARLEGLGHRFRTQTDTEVIVHGYEAWGAAVLDHLRGMFAIALWDSHAERLLLARDRAGEKPLYYTRVADALLFASEIKALFEHPGVLRRENRDALPVYLALGYVPPPQTMFDGIFKLSPGELIIFERGQIARQERYWRPHMDTSRRLVNYPDTVRRVRELVEQAVETRMVSDVPVGAFLSGGVDSTAVVALMSRLATEPVKTFTVGFLIEDDPVRSAKFNVDVGYAEMASRHLRTDHHAITIRVDARLAELLPRLVYAMDEPVAQQSILQTTFVAALARSKGVPVLLSGDGGDELFAGYPHYRADYMVQRYQRIPRVLRASALDPLLERSARGRKLVEKAGVTDPTARYLNWMRMIDPARLPGLLRDEALGESALTRIAQTTAPLLAAPRTSVFADRIAYTSLGLWLPEDSNMRVDKLSMAMSVESRAPLEDHLLVNLAFGIPFDYKQRQGDVKRVFKDAVRELIPAPILKRPKWGFAPPTSQWLRSVFRPLVDEHLAPAALERSGVFNAEYVARAIDSHMNRGGYEVWTLWPLLIYQLWHAAYIQQKPGWDAMLTPNDLLQSTVAQ